MQAGGSKIISIAFFLGLFLLLYFGCDTKDNSQKLAEKSRVLNFEKISPQMLLKSAQANLVADETIYLDALKIQTEQAETAEERYRLKEKEASFWFTKEQEAISGAIAQQIAEGRGDSKSWSIAGTTFSLCLQREKDEDIRDFCFNRAINAFEKAISLDPDNIDHQVNMALCYVEKPLEENPMKGIQLLLGLNKNNPENISVLTQLGRLSIKTNQIDRAIARFNSILVLEPKNREANCYLGSIYEQQGNSMLSKKHYSICKREE